MKRQMTVTLVGDKRDTLKWARYLAGECEYRLQNDDPDDSNTGEVAYGIAIKIVKEAE